MLMEDDLLLAKLRMPLLRTSFVARPRLLARLDLVLPQGNLWPHKLTLISAPAGYGKTTLIGQWLSNKDCAAAWLTLDENDNDPTRFLTYLIAAFQRKIPDLGAGLLQSLQSASVTTPGLAAVKLALTSLLNELEALSDPLVLVLDDYHLIENGRVHEVVSFLLDHQPPHFHLAIASRSDPPLPIARLRAQGQLVEVRAADLFFAPDEATVFLNEAMGLGLAADQIKALIRRTEGWIAGLQLAALALQGRLIRQGADQKEAVERPSRTATGQVDVPAFIEAFTGSHRFVLDYLTKEVLNRQDADTRAFLLKTAVLEHLCAALCDAITGRKDSEQMLESLSAANLFIIPLDDNCRWYRYHHLFADLLRQRLHKEQPDLMSKLHGQASAWYEAEGWTADAVRHALEAGEFGRAASLIEQNGWSMLMRGEMNTLLRWLDVLPEEILNERPALGLRQAWALAFSGRWVEMEKALRTIRTTEEAGEMAAVRAYATAVQGLVAQTRDLAEQALAQLPAEATFLRALVTFCVAITHFSSGQPEPAARALAEVIRLGGEAGQPHLVMTATAHLGHVYEMQGRLHEALATHRKALQLGSAAGERPAPFQGIASVGIAEVLYEWNDLPGALRHALDGIRLTERGGFVSYMLAGNACLVQVYQAQDELKSAEERLQKGEQMAARHKFRYMEGVFAELQVRQWLAEGKLAAAVHWVEGEDLRDGKNTALAQEVLHMALARVLMAQGLTAANHDLVDQALAILNRAAAEAVAAGRRKSELRILVLQAVARQQMGQTEQALEVLERALALAKLEGYVRSFVDEGRPMAELLQLAVSGGKRAGYAATLLAAFDKDVLAASLPAGGLVEPLSGRELEVLRLVAAGLTNREIAAELVIALSTVKSHINNIYGKLSVERRTQAVARAQALDLL